MAYTTESFIKKAIEKFGDRYDYSKVDYINSSTKVCIICKKHGEFWQVPSSHLRGYECPYCANEKRGVRDTKEDFLIKAKKVHGDKYDYSKVEYINASTKICIICHDHGEFWQLPSAHLSGQGCPKCIGRDLTNEQLVEKFKKVHGDRYDYSKINYVNSVSKLTIICPKHGEFLQSSAKHLQGRGCPKCAVEKRSNAQRVSKEEFISRANKIHECKYSYEFSEYTDMDNKIKILCPKHGEFFQRPYDHLQGHGCPRCGTIISLSEIEIYKFLCDELGSDKVEYHCRNILSNNRELDIYIPSKKIAIEYNGLKWHSEEYGKGKFYHLDKTDECKSLGIKLIHIFEDEYIFHKEIVLSKLSHLIGCGTYEKIMARKCSVKEITKIEAKEFLSKFHIQGYGNSTLSIGCFNKGKLIGVMSFEKEKNERWVLSRFASDYNYICQGIGGKLLSFFIKKYSPIQIKSFADRRWTIDENDNLYIKLGFIEDKILPPDYHYVLKSNPTIRIHKFNLRKKALHIKYGLSMDMTESEMVEKLGYAKIWDCGLIRYIWKKGAN